MKAMILTILVAALAFSAGESLADKGNGTSKGNKKPADNARVEKAKPGKNKDLPADLEDFPQVIDDQNINRHTKRDCPPGLAKKSVPCVPPGQAGKYGVGDILPGDYIIIGDPGRYGLRDGGSYVRLGNFVYRINKDTREVLNLIGAVADILD